MNPAIRQKLEDIELDLEVINDHVEDELTKLAQKAVEHKAPGLFETTAGLTAALKKMQSESDARAEEWKLCMGTRLVACRLLSSFPGEAAVVKHRQATLEKVAADFWGSVGNCPISSVLSVLGSKALPPTRLPIHNPCKPLVVERVGGGCAAIVHGKYEKRYRADAAIAG